MNSLKKIAICILSIGVLTNTVSAHANSNVSTPTVRKVNTGNSAIDAVFQNAYPTDNGNFGFHLPNKTQAQLLSELSSIPNANKQAFQNGGGFRVDFSDGKRVNLYPARSSTAKPGWSIYMTPTSKNPKYKGDTAQ